MIQGVMFDLRAADIKTHVQMDAELDERFSRCHQEFGHFEPIAIVLHESQVKWLKLDLYEHGKKTSAELKKMRLDNWKDVPVITTDEWEGIPRPNCGHIHDDEDEWYDEG